MQDELIDLLGGADNVAELTGRKSRMVRGKDGKLRFLSRASHNVPLDQVRLFSCCRQHTVSAGHGMLMSTAFALSCRYQWRLRRSRAYLVAMSARSCSS